jgi:hypothetical protein
LIQRLLNLKENSKKLFTKDRMAEITGWYQPQGYKLPKGNASYLYLDEFLKQHQSDPTYSTFKKFLQDLKKVSESLQF